MTRIRKWLKWMQNNDGVTFVVVASFIGLIIVIVKVCQLLDPFLAPLIDARFYIAYLGLLALGWGCVAIYRQRSWFFEEERVRRGLQSFFGVSDQVDVPAHIREEILALIPCRAQNMQGRLTSFKGNERLWLCFLADCLLVVSARSGEVTRLAVEDLRKLYLADSTRRGRYPFAIEEPGGLVSSVVVQRLDDLVRILNVLSARGVVLSYLKDQHVP